MRVFEKVILLSVGLLLMTMPTRAFGKPKDPPASFTPLVKAQNILFNIDQELDSLKTPANTPQVTTIQAHVQAIQQNVVMIQQSLSKGVLIPAQTTTPQTTSVAPSTLPSQPTLQTTSVAPPTLPSQPTLQTTSIVPSALPSQPALQTTSATPPAPLSQPALQTTSIAPPTPLPQPTLQTTPPVQNPISANPQANIPASPSRPGLAPGLYIQVIDGAIQLTNGGGSQNFAAGQFGYTSSFIKPPVILPANPGLKFTPPPSFSQSQSNSSNPGSSNKSGAIDCEVR